MNACQSVRYVPDHRHVCIHPSNWPHGHHLCACETFWRNDETAGDLLDLLAVGA